MQINSNGLKIDAAELDFQVGRCTEPLKKTCAELALAPSGHVVLRSNQAPDAFTVLTGPEWADFLRNAKDGVYDHLAV